MLSCSGDFYQLPPPFGKIIFQRPDGPEDDSADFRGYCKWKNGVTHVIILTENHRQTDLEWAKALERWRTNQQTRQDIENFNARRVKTGNSNVLLLELIFLHLKL